MGYEKYSNETTANDRIRTYRSLAVEEALINLRGVDWCCDKLGEAVAYVDTKEEASK